jgi:ATP-dependent RNA helicase
MAASRSSRRVVTDETEDQDLSKIEFETSEDVKVVPTFDAMNLREDLLRGIYAYGKKFGRYDAPLLQYGVNT